MGGTVTKISPRDADKRFKVTTGAKHTFQLLRFHCHVLEIEDVHFNHDSAVLLPDYGSCFDAPSDGADPLRITGLAVLRACLVHAKAHPDQSLLIAGHTDTSGRDSYNLTLSEKRGEVVRAILEGDRAAWVKIVPRHNKDEDIRQILAWVAADLGWGCAPGGAAERKKTKAAIQTFQQSYNDVYKQEIQVDGIVGDQTWGAIFDVCVTALGKLLGGEDATELGEWRKELRWVDGVRHSVGCGETHPIESPEKDNYRSETNRRVELLFFDAVNMPRLDCHPSKGVCKAKTCEIYDLSCYKRDYIPCPPLSATHFAIRIVDEKDQPLQGERYVIHQQGKRHEGVLDADGLAVFTEADETQPFKIELPGRVCAIKYGAIIQVNSPGVEYGGTVYNWPAAETDMSVWGLYLNHDPTPARQQMNAGPTTFWQHEYITRREIRIRKVYLEKDASRVEMHAIPVQIRTGPLLRFTSHTRAVIWHELETPGLVRARVRPAGGAAASEKLFHSATVIVGGRYFAAVPVSFLEEDAQYEYTLELGPLPAEGEIPKQGGFTAEVFPYKLPVPVLENIKEQLKPCSFDGSEWISFRTLRRSYGDHLRFAHGSCWKRHGVGGDAFEGFGKTLRATDRADWPRFLMFTGDQIYADDQDGGRVHIARAQRVAWRTPGPSFGDRLIQGAWAGRFASRFRAFQPAFQGQFANQLVPPTLTIDNTLWTIPVEFKETVGAKQFTRAGNDGYQCADFAEFAFAYERNWVEVPEVRQTLAAIPSFMIFDDHEITDDWNFDEDWVRIVHDAPRWANWPDTMTDGLAAYWTYQGWGNLDPSEWNRHPLARILMDAQERGIDALPALRTAIAKEVRPPRQAGETRSIDWHYKLPITPDFIVLNGRADRVVTSSAKTSQMLTEGQFRWLQKELEAADQAGRPVAFVVAGVPVLLPPGLAFGQALHVSDEPGLQEEIGGLVVSHKQRRETDIEHWLADGSFVRMRHVFESLARTRRALKSVVFLSGDVHFSYNMRARLLDENKETIPFPEMVQLVSSALQNEIGLLRTFKLRRVAEPSSGALTDAENVGGDQDQVAMAVVRWLATPFSPNIKLLGMEHTIAGFRGIQNLRQTLLVDNSVAVVDAWLVQPGDPNFAAGEFVLRERHLIDGLTPLARAERQPPPSRLSFGFPVPGREPAATGIAEFWYQTMRDGSAMTMAPVLGDGRKPI